MGRGQRLGTQSLAPTRPCLARPCRALPDLTLRRHTLDPLLHQKEGATLKWPPYRTSPNLSSTHRTSAHRMKPIPGYA
jgi:hypothetical protein